MNKAINTVGALPPRLNTEEKFEKAMIHLKHLQTLWESSPIEKAFRGLIVGMKGTGKTRALLTLPRPLLIDVFDPDGLASITDKNGNLPDGIFAKPFYPDSRENPIQYTKWKIAFEKNEKSGLFEHISSYVLDSSTNWLISLIWHITKQNKKPLPDLQPTINNWHIQKLIAIDYTMRFMSLPCNFVTTGHLMKGYIITTDKKGEIITKEEEFNILIGPKAGANLLALYSEVYIAEHHAINKIDKKPVPYFWRTTYENKGKRASSRLSQGTKLNDIEPQNFKALFKKVGINVKDKT